MNNYQLYRSNVLLGGQLKWNIILGTENGSLRVRDFHLTPISEWVQFNRHIEENLLQYKHKDNVRDLYKKVGNYFFEPCINPRLRINYPYIVEEGDTQSTYNDIYDMGLSHVQYSIYKKSFQYFCPLWLEDIGSNSKLKFQFTFRGRNKVGDVYEYSRIISRSLEINLNEVNGETYHHQFTKYLKDYIEYLSQDNEVIGDRIINVDFKGRNMSVEGLDVTSGELRIRDTSLTLPNLYSRERPLMEFDKLIIDNLKNNYLITKQLFNFNFMFNINDVIDKTIVDMLYGGYVNIIVDTYLDDKKLDTVSFDTNYDYIDRGDGVNVLDYLQDYHCINLIDKNKINPTITHWNLVESNTHFNLYGGFEEYSMFMKNACNLWIDKIQKEDDYSALDWCVMNRVEDRDLLKVMTEDENESKYLTKIDLSQKYIRNNQVTIDDSLGVVGAGIVLTNTTERNIKAYISDLGRSSSTLLTIDDNTFIYDYSLDHTKLMFICNGDASTLTYRRICKTLAELLGSEKVEELAFKDTLVTIYKYLTSIVEPTIIKIDKSIIPIHANSPFTDSEEIEYIRKDKNRSSYHVRYDGGIVPRFSSDVTSYKIKQVTESEFRSNWDSSIGSNQLPLFPSKDYFYIDKADIDDTFNELGENHWFSSSSLLCLPVVQNLTIQYDQSNPKSIRELIKEKLYQIYKVHVDRRVQERCTDPEVYDKIRDQELENILNVYDYSSDYEYTNLDNIDNYTYNIKLTLK